MLTGHFYKVWCPKPQKNYCKARKAKLWGLLESMQWYHNDAILNAPKQLCVAPSPAKCLDIGWHSPQNYSTIIDNIHKSLASKLSPASCQVPTLSDPTASDIQDYSFMAKLSIGLSFHNPLLAQHHSSIPPVFTPHPCLVQFPPLWIRCTTACLSLYTGTSCF